MPIIKRVGSIGNYYGPLLIKQEGFNFYWAIKDVGNIYWEKIPKYVYDSLFKFEMSNSKTIEIQGEPFKTYSNSYYNL